MLATSSTRILVNGTPGKPILPCQGFRLGDPLSPMLFILCMEPLRALFEHATNRGWLGQLARNGLRQRTSMFADYVVVFIKPTMLEATTCAALLQVFAQASGLVVNMNKSAIWPIRCSHDEVDLVKTIMGCLTSAFPCTYLGLPLALRKQSAAQMQGLVDKVRDCLPHWKSDLLLKSGRLILIQSVLCAIPVHSMLALSLPAKTFSALVKICRGFLWCGKSKARGGNCSVAWDEACTPKWAGGLGIPDLRWLNKALQARWPWLQRTNKKRSWAEFPIAVPPELMALAQAAIRMTVGDGSAARF